MTGTEENEADTTVPFCLFLAEGYFLVVIICLSFLLEKEEK